MIGQTLGHYKILEKLGEGGMGEVYRAEDTKLGREVAIKVLPEAFTSDPERLARFEREAKLLASLNHPHIAQIHALEDVDGQKLLVMELVDGETLAEHIANGPIPLESALPIALQIAEALEGAHERGIVHRDLKPANIKLTPEGEAKVLDFGLAKIWLEERGEDVDLSLSPTLTAQMTQAGVIMGTAAYMSPEQARGGPVDKRTDIWAFGAVLYEMVSGRKPFAGEALTDTLARVIEREPDWDALTSGISPTVEAFLRRCLAKDPRQRIHDIADMRLAIEGAFETGVERASFADDPWRRGVLPWSIAVAAIVVAVAVGVFGNWDRNETQMRPPLRRFSFDTVEGTTLPRGFGGVMAVSPDGETIVYVGESADGRQLFRRSLAEHEAIPIQGTEGATMPFFSPDGQWLAFSDDSILTIKRVPFSGGEPFTICTQCGDGFWGDDGSVIFEREGAVIRIPAFGGQPEVLVKPMPESGVAAMTRVKLLPGGTGVLFEIGFFEFGGVGVFSLETLDLRIITDNGSDPFYSPTGHILFARDNTLLALPFDLERFQTTGEPTPVISGVRVENGGSVQAALSRDGLLVYVAAADETGSKLVWVDRKGRVQSVLEEGRSFWGPRISPDGQKIAVQVNAGGKTDIWLHQSGTLRPLTNTGNAANPIWTPDGLNVTFSSRLTESFAIQSVSSDGGGETRTLVSSDSPIVPEAWSLDGTRLIFLEGGSDLFVTDVRDPGSRAPYAVSEFSEHSATLSPSGKWVAYVSDQTGSNEVYVRPFPGPGREYDVSRRGGQAPSWGRDDSELMFRSFDDRHLLIASLHFDPFQVEQTVLFSAQQYWTIPRRAHYDVDPDGKRLLMLNQRDSNARRSKLRVVESWFTELERLVPAEK